MSCTIETSPARRRICTSLTKKRPRSTRGLGTTCNRHPGRGYLPPESAREADQYAGGDLLNALAYAERIARERQIVVCSRLSIVENTVKAVHRDLAPIKVIGQAGIVLTAVESAGGANGASDQLAAAVFSVSVGDDGANALIELMLGTERIRDAGVALEMAVEPAEVVILQLADFAPDRRVAGVINERQPIAFVARLGPGCILRQAAADIGQGAAGISAKSVHVHLLGHGDGKAALDVAQAVGPELVVGALVLTGVGRVLAKIDGV